MAEESSANSSSTTTITSTSTSDQNDSDDNVKISTSVAISTTCIGLKITPKEEECSVLNVENNVKDNVEEFCDKQQQPTETTATTMTIIKNENVNMNVPPDLSSLSDTNMLTKIDETNAMEIDTQSSSSNIQMETSNENVPLSRTSQQSSLNIVIVNDFEQIEISNNDNEDIEMQSRNPVTTADDVSCSDKTNNNNNNNNNDTVQQFQEHQSVHHPPVTDSINDEQDHGLQQQLSSSSETNCNDEQQDRSDELNESKLLMSNNKNINELHDVDSSIQSHPTSLSSSSSSSSSMISSSTPPPPLLDGHYDYKTSNQMPLTSSSSPTISMIETCTTIDQQTMENSCSSSSLSSSSSSTITTQSKIDCNKITETSTASNNDNNINKNHIDSNLLNEEDEERILQPCADEHTAIVEIFSEEFLLGNDHATNVPCSKPDNDVTKEKFEDVDKLLSPSIAPTTTMIATTMNDTDSNVQFQAHESTNYDQNNDNGDIDEILDQHASADLFESVKFSLCETVSDSDKIKKIMVGHGAKFLNYLSDSATYFIADDPDHPSVSEAIDIFEKPVLTSQWVWLSLRANRMLPIEPFILIDSNNDRCNRLFSNIVACASQISLNDLKNLWSMLSYYGGKFQLHLDHNCTHLLTTKIFGKKYEIAAKESSFEKIHIVTPDWIIDSIKQQKLCDEKRYHPRLLIDYHQNVHGRNSSLKNAKSSNTMAIKHSIKSEQLQDCDNSKTSLTNSTPAIKSVTMSISTEAVVTAKKSSNDVPITTATATMIKSSSHSLSPTLSSPSSTSQPTKPSFVPASTATVPHCSQPPQQQSHAQPQSLLASKQYHSQQQIRHHSSQQVMVNNNTSNVQTMQQPPNQHSQRLPLHQFQQQIRQPLVHSIKNPNIGPQSQQNIVQQPQQPPREIVPPMCQQQQQQQQIMSTHQPTGSAYPHLQQGSGQQYTPPQMIPNQSPGPQQVYIQQQQQQSAMYQQQNQQQYRGQYVPGPQQQQMMSQRMLSPSSNSGMMQQQYRSQQPQQAQFSPNSQQQQFRPRQPIPKQQQYVNRPPQMVPVGPQQQYMVNNQANKTNPPQQQQQQMVRMIQPPQQQSQQFSNQSNYAGNHQSSNIPAHPSQLQNQQRMSMLRISVPPQQQQILNSNQQSPVQPHPVCQSPSGGGTSMMNYVQQSKPGVRPGMMIPNNANGGLSQQQQQTRPAGMMMRPMQPYSSQQQQQMGPTGHAMQQMSTRLPQTPTGGQQPMSPQQLQFIRQQRWSQPDYNQQQQQYTRPQVIPPGVQQQQAWIRQPIQQSQHRFPLQQPQQQQHVSQGQMIRMVTKPMPPNPSNLSPQQQQQFYDPSSSLLMNNKVRANINHSPQHHQQDSAIAVQQSANSVIHNQQSPMVSIQAMNSPNNNSMIPSPVASSQQQSLVNNLPQSAIKTQLIVTNTNSSSVSSPSHHQQQSSSPGTPAQVSVPISSSSSVVNEKTKTALANLLNNRLNSQLQQQNRNSGDTNSITTVTTPSLSSGSSSSPSSPALHNHQSAKITLQPVTVYSPNNNNNVNNSGASNNVMNQSPVHQQADQSSLHNQHPGQHYGGQPLPSSSMIPSQQQPQNVGLYSSNNQHAHYSQQQRPMIGPQSIHVGQRYPTPSPHHIPSQHSPIGNSSALPGKPNTFQHSSASSSPVPTGGSTPSTPSPTSAGLHHLSGHIHNYPVAPNPHSFSSMHHSNQILSPMQSFNQHHSHQTNVTGSSSHHHAMQPHHHSLHQLGQVRQTFCPNANQQQQHPPYIPHPPNMQQHPHANRTMVPFHHHQQHGATRQHLSSSFQQQHLQSLAIRFYGHETTSGSLIGNKSCLIGCTFYISNVYAENRYTSNLIDGWKRRIEKFGGKVVTDLINNNVTHVITEHLNLPMRTSQCQYQQILPQQNGDHRYVSIFWLNDVLESGRLLPPWRFYHLPVAFNPQLMPCKHHVISITNFHQDERSMLKHLIVRTGARYTDYLTQKNTVLICKRPEGEKYLKAMKWRMAVVNITWLQDVLFGNGDCISVGNLPKRYRIFDHQNVQSTKINGKENKESEKNSESTMQKDTFKLDYNVSQGMMSSWRSPIRYDEKDLIKHQEMVKQLEEQKKIQEKTNNQKTDTESSTTEDNSKTNKKFNGEISSNNDEQNTSDYKQHGSKRLLENDGEENVVKNALPNGDHMNIDDQDEDSLILSTKRFKTSDENEDPHSIVKEVVMSSLDNILAKSESENLNLINNEEENSCQTNDSFYGSSTSNNTPTNGTHPMISVNGTNSDSNNSSNLHDISADDIVTLSSSPPLQNDANSSEFKVPLDVNQRKFQLKLKQQLRPSNEYVIMLVGLIRRSGQYERYRQIIQNLGGRVVQQPADCLKATHLVIGSEWNRTLLPKISINFLCTFARTKFMVNSDWLDQSSKAEHFLSEQQFEYARTSYDNHPENNVQDQQVSMTNIEDQRSNSSSTSSSSLSSFTSSSSLIFETYQIDLCKSWQRRRSDLFHNILCLLTPSLIPAPPILKQIIEANGGQAVLKRMPNRRQLMHLFDQNDGPKWPIKIVIITCETDLHLLADYLIQHPQVEIVNCNFIVDSILKQNIDYKSFRLIPEQLNGLSNTIKTTTTNICGTSVNSNAKDSNNNIHLNQNHHSHSNPHLVPTTTAPLPK